MDEKKQSLTMSYINIILGAIQIAVLYLPAFFLNDLLAHKWNYSDVNIYAIPLFLGIWSLIAIISSSKKEAVLKWLLSLPVAFAFWVYLIVSQFGIRSSEWVMPGHGESSAIENFVGYALLSSSFKIDLIFLIAGLCISSKKKPDTTNKSIFVLQKIICSAVSLGIVIAIVVLNAIMPEFSPVYG